MGEGVSLSPLEFPTASNINHQLQPTALFTDFQHPFRFPVPVIMLTQPIHLEYRSSSSVTVKIMAVIYYYPMGCIYSHIYVTERIFVAILQIKNQRLNKGKQCIHNIQPGLELTFKF